LLLAFNVISDPDFGFGVDLGRLRGDILSHTWPVRGGDQPRTTPMPFERISTDLCGSLDHPRRAETAERATWGTKTPPRPPTAGTPHPPRLVCGGNHGTGTHWCPSGGGSPVAVPRPPAPQAQSLYFCGNAHSPPPPPLPTVARPSGTVAINKAPGLPSYGNEK
jgi:hypothetical protein